MGLLILSSIDPVLTSSKEKKNIICPSTLNLLSKGASSRFTHCIIPRRHSESKPLLEALKSVLWYVLSRWRGCVQRLIIFFPFP